MKFIKCKNAIVNVAEIKAIYTHDQYLYIECTEKEYSIYFDSAIGAREELNRIYKELEEL